LGPLKRVVCNLLPALLAQRVVGASLKLLVVCDRLGVAVVLDVRLVEGWRHEVVLSTRYEQQRRPILVPEVHVSVLMARREVGQDPTPNEIARRGDVVALVDLPGFLLSEGVGEGLVELLRGEPYGLVAVGGVLEHREGGPDLGDRNHLDALCWHGVYNHTSCPVAVVEQDLD
jgi:hypothetical protein